MKHLDIVLAMCLGFALILPPGCATQNRGYTSTAYLSFCPPRPGVFNTDARDIVGDILILQKSYVQLATDQAVLRRAVNDDIDQDGTKLDRIRKTSWFTGDLTGTVKLLQEELSVAGVKDTTLIRISLSGPNPKELPEVVNAVADAMIHETDARCKARHKPEHSSLDTRMDETKGQIAAKQKAIEQIRGSSEIPTKRSP